MALRVDISKFPGLPVAGSMDVLAENLKCHFGRVCWSWK